MPRVGAQASAKEATGLKPPSFNAPNIVVAEADNAARFQTIDFKRRRTVYKSLYAPFTWGVTTLMTITKSCLFL